MSRRRVIPRRKRFFLGCEGESEQAYAGLLQRLADAAELKVHIVAKNLQPAGDPLTLASKALKLFANEEKKGGFVSKAVMLDSDTLDESPERAQRCRTILLRADFIAIWQVPKHEALLLRHFPGDDRRRPTRHLAMPALIERWPDYHKNMPAADLQRVLSLEHVMRAANVTPSLALFLQQLGFTQPR